MSSCLKLFGKLSPMTPQYSGRGETVQKLSVDDYHRWIEQQPSEVAEGFELIDGQIQPLLNDSERTRMLRLLQWQLRAFLQPSPNLENTQAKRNRLGHPEREAQFEVQIRPSLRLDNFNELKPAILVQKSCINTTQKTEPGSTSVWIIDVLEAFEVSQHQSLSQASSNQINSSLQHRIQLYARAAVSDYWLLSLESSELQLYQQPSEIKYQRHRVLQVGDWASPSAVPLTVKLQEPVPMYFMTQTLKGQQTYQSSALPISFSTAQLKPLS